MVCSIGLCLQRNNLFVGLLGYSAWRFVQAIKDTDGHGNEAKGIVVRASLLISGLIHLGLAVWATSKLIPGTGSSAQDTQQGFLNSEAGQITLALTGFAVIGIYSFLESFYRRIEAHAI